MLRRTAQDNPRALRQGQFAGQMVSGHALGALINHLCELGLRDEMLLMFCGTVWAVVQWLVPDLANKMRGGA